MEKVVNKWFFVWNGDREKQWLEEMALKGYRLRKVQFGKYIFQESKPEKLVYQFDFRNWSSKMGEEEYLQLYEDTGWEFISRFGGWYYFVHKAQEGCPDISIFNNNQSKRTMYRRLVLFLIITGLPLYIQTFIIFPQMPSSAYGFPNFYFFFRIIASLLTFAHMLALARVAFMYRKMKSYLTE
jgi:hypothetical protein